MRKSESKVPARNLWPLVPVFEQDQRRIPIDLRGRVCPYCQFNDLPTALKQGRLVAADGIPMHLNCACKKFLPSSAKEIEKTAKQEKERRQLGPEATAELESFLVPPEGIWIHLGNQPGNRLRENICLANTFTARPGAALARQLLDS